LKVSLSVKIPEVGKDVQMRTEDAELVVNMFANWVELVRAMCSGLGPPMHINKWQNAEANAL